MATLNFAISNKMQTQDKTAAELPKVKPKENPQPGFGGGFLLL